MNVLSHMEVVFGVAVVAGCMAAALPDWVGAHAHAQAETAAATTAAGMPVVVVRAKRLSALEKRAAGGALDGAAAGHGG